MPLITLLGPTATGKTRLAALLAAACNGEIISADSRQVYRKMNLGTGKDYNDYIVNGKQITYYLIDIADPGYEYSVHEFQRDFHLVFQDILSRIKQPILCGGTGLYLEAILKGYRLPAIPEDTSLRNSLNLLSDEELCTKLSRLKSLHATTDTVNRNRLLRAIEIETWLQKNPDIKSFQPVPSIIFGINFPREIIRQHITHRLQQRLENGMIEEIQQILNSGVRPETLKAYGLEYKYITQYIIKELTYNEMFTLLNTAIHQFAKRQMTWFRRMERNGLPIRWIDGNLPDKEKVNRILEVISLKK
ncbi:MAG: tRNA (adenosine(37)-N6)-dimethylallyltransferase MiaA [Lentimicrobiaceae bacterium]|jgi:tRNA dimethylallyltransferase|nr:tRNA (adenosine(37)-N6)-dimethylallyltransferase MiaA [Lentimicrobiaceae bacterium]